MKTLKFVAYTLLSICFFVSCDVSQVDDEIQQENSSLENLTLENSSKYSGKKYRNGKLRIDRNQVVVAFDANFFTSSPGIMPDESCNEPRLLETQIGEGTAKHIGDFSIHFNFCIDITDVVAPPSEEGEPPITGNEALPYYNGTATITFSNGDQLFGKVSGAVLPTDKPGYDAEFMDPMVFTGGTGRFEGAKGGGVTNSYVTIGVKTEHEFKAVLVLPKHRGNKRWDDDKWDHRWDDRDDRDDDDDEDDD